MAGAETTRDRMRREMRRTRMAEIDVLRFSGKLSTEEIRQLSEEWDALMREQELDAYEEYVEGNVCFSC